MLSGGSVLDLKPIFVQAMDSLPDGPSRVLAMAYLANEEDLAGSRGGSAQRDQAGRVGQDPRHEPWARPRLRDQRTASRQRSRPSVAPSSATGLPSRSFLRASQKPQLVERGNLRRSSTGWKQWADGAWNGPAAELAQSEARRAFARERGLDFVLADESRAEILIPLGRLEDARRGAQQLAARGAPPLLYAPEALRAELELGHDPGTLVALVRDLATESTFPEVPAVCASQLARLEVTGGRREDALAAAAVIDDLVLARSRAFTAYLPPLGRLLAGLDLVERLEALTAATPADTPRDQHTRTTLEALLRRRTASTTRPSNGSARWRCGGRRAAPIGWSTPTLRGPAGAWPRSGTQRPRPS